MYLAKLSLGDEAKEKAKEDMQKMLDYVEKLDELDNRWSRTTVSYLW